MTNRVGGRKRITFTVCKHNLAPSLVGIGNHQILLQKILMFLDFYKVLQQYEKVQTFKTLFCRKFLLPNMHPKRNYTAKTIFGFLK